MNLACTGLTCDLHPGFPCLKQRALLEGSPPQAWPSDPRRGTATPGPCLPNARKCQVSWADIQASRHCES